MEASARREFGRLVWVLAAVLVFVAGSGRCGSAASIWPLRRGQAVAGIDIGGPVVNLGGAQLPIPYPVGRFRCGVTDRLNLNLGGHLLLPAFGVAGFDAGASYHFVDQAGWRPCLGVGVGEVGLVEFDGGGGTSFLTQAEVTASYLRPNHSLSYFGVHTLYQIFPRFYMTYSPYVGHNFSVGRGLSVNLEMKWFAAAERTKPRAVTYSLPVANHGGLGFVAGLSYHLGGWYH